MTAAERDGPAYPALDPSPAALGEMVASAAAWLEEFHSSIRERPVYPDAAAIDLRHGLSEPLPAAGRPFAELLAQFREIVVPGSRLNGHPRFFGYVAGPGTPVAALADLLASSLNVNLTAWRSSPAATRIEQVAIDWIREALGVEAGASGLFLSGGSMANLTALAAARHHRCGEAVARGGMRAATKPLALYVSSEGHHSIDKAAALLGLGHDAVRHIATDSAYRMDVAALEHAIAVDRAAGCEPFCIVASAGTVVSGAIDPLAGIAAVAHRERLWLHVDACYGGFARLAPSVRSRFDGLEAADSIALDPHKWLYLPADVGCLIYRDPARVGSAFALGADYTRVLDGEGEESFAFWDLGPELTRRFRALKVWMTLAHAGAAEIAAAIESNLDCARYLAHLIQRSDDFELLAPVELSIVCFRHLPERFRRQGTASPRSEDDERGLDAWNERLLVALQRDGSSYLSNASLHGRFALRACVLNYRTTRRDMEFLLDDLRRIALALE